MSVATERCDECGTTTDAPWSYFVAFTDETLLCEFCLRIALDVIHQARAEDMTQHRTCVIQDEM